MLEGSEFIVQSSAGGGSVCVGGGGGVGMGVCVHM